jgi:hypothetical protein
MDLALCVQPALLWAGIGLVAGAVVMAVPLVCALRIGYLYGSRRA